MSKLDRVLRLPVKSVDGVWEMDHGGVVPAKEGACAELLIQASDIANRQFLDRVTARSVVKVFEVGTELRIFLVHKSDSKIQTHLKRHLLQFWPERERIVSERLPKSDPLAAGLVSIHIGPWTHSKIRYGDQSGGLWLILEGTKAVRLDASSICLPEGISEGPVHSLNHAFTKLSEVFEPWRISHTGNVYDRMFYQEKNGKWYPLSVLRDLKVATQDEQIAHELWRDFLAKAKADFELTGE